MNELVDFQGTGEIIDLQGRITLLTDQEALRNAINLWICSFRGERLYHPNHGGVITPYLFKPMSEDRAIAIQDDIINGLRSSFSPSVEAKCCVNPDYTRNIYWIELKGYCPLLQVSIFDNLGVKVQV